MGKLNKRRKIANDTSATCRRSTLKWVAMFVLAIGLVPHPDLFSQCVVTSQVQHRASDGGSQDKLGSSLAVDMDHALIGAPGHPDFTDKGAVYAINATNGAWGDQKKLTASDGEPGDTFGSSVAIDGYWGLVGADGAGSAYLFHRDGDVWTETQKLTPQTTAPFFGFSVAISGNTLVVGAYGADNFAGAAFVYEFDGARWQPSAALTAPNPMAFDFFGASVAVSGNSIAVGAYGEEVGAVYMFDRQAEAWDLTEELRPNDLKPGDSFGRVVALNASKLVCGAPRHDSNGTDAGAVYTFISSGSTWPLEQKLVGGDSMGGDRFGTSVAVNDHLIIIGAPLWDDASGITDRGAAYLFANDGTEWLEETKLVACSPYGWFEDEMGTAVSVSDNVALVATVLADSPGRDAGHVYTFELDCRASTSDCAMGIDGATDTCAGCNLPNGSCENLAPQSCLKRQGCAELDGLCTQLGQSCGNRCPLPGDVNGDGFVDVDDTAGFLACLGGPTDPITFRCAQADLNADTRVDLDDVAAFFEGL